MDCGVLDGSSKVEQKYPFDILDRARNAVQGVVQLVQRLAPDHIVVEDTNPGGRASRHSQRFLEQAHCLLLLGLEGLSQDVQAGRKYIHYVSTGDWRRAIGLGLTPDDRANNKALAKVRATLKRQLKRKATPKELSDAKRAAGISGKRSIKHAAVEWANREYGLELTSTQADAADAAGLGAGWLRMQPNAVGSAAAT